MNPCCRLLRRAAATAVLALGSAIAHAADIDIETLNLLNQSEFRALSEDVGALLSFKPLIPAEPLGITGFDVGAVVTGTRLEHRSLWRRATAGDDVPSVVPLLSLRAHKGLPLNLDVGLGLAAVPDSDIRLISGELRWAALPGSAVLPAVALRLGLSKLSGVDQLEARTASYDISVSKGLAFVTPYAGIGRVHVKSRPQDTPLLRSESFSMNKVFVGANVGLGLGNIALEADRTGDATSFGLKIGLRF